MSRSTTTAEFDAMDIDTMTTNGYEDDGDNDEYGDTEILNDEPDDETFTINSRLDDDDDDDDDGDDDEGDHSMMGGDKNSITIATNSNATRSATVAAATVSTNDNTGHRTKRSKIANIRSTSRIAPINAKTAAVTTTTRRASATATDKNTKAATNSSVVTSANNFALDEMFDDISSRYDTCIVYALDECLTRGAYHVFAKWFYRYISKENLPGSMVVVGFSANVSYPSSLGTANNYCSSAVTATAVTVAAENRRVNLGGSIPVPYVRLDPSDAYAIFDFKRQTGYPAIVLLVTLPASRLEMCLSCDGSILVQARHNMRRNMIEVAEVLQQLTRAYLNDLYTAVNTMNCDNNNDDDQGLLQGNCEGDYEDDEIDSESTVAAMNDPRRCCDGDLAKVDFEQRCDKNGNNCGDNTSKYLTEASASSSSPALFSMMIPPAPKEHYEDRGDDETEDEFTIATAISIPKGHHHRSIVTTTTTSDNNDAVIDGSSGRNTANNSTNATATAIGSGQRVDISPIAATTVINHSHNISSTNNGSNANSGGNMTSQLRGQNHRILQQLQQMDRTLTETHPRDFVPIVHGETLDITIPSSAFYRY